MKTLLTRATAANKPFVVMLLVVVTLAGVVGHCFYNEPQLAVGTLAPQAIHEPATAWVEDTETTKSEREAAWRDALPVLMVDEVANQKITQNLAQQLDEGTKLRKLAGSLPFVKISTLSISTQTYLRCAPSADWPAILVVQNQRPGV